MSTYEQKLRIAKRHSEQRQRIRQALTMRAHHQKKPRKGDEAHWEISRRREAREHEYKARLREVPEDTRTLTGRLLGDPKPGQSALDRRGT